MEDVINKIIQSSNSILNAEDREVFNKFCLSIINNYIAYKFNVGGCSKCKETVDSYIIGLELYGSKKDFVISKNATFKDFECIIEAFMDNHLNRK